MPTVAPRRWCLPLAIRWFQRQTYTGRKELVIVFSGEGTVADLIPTDDPEVRLIEVPPHYNLGDKHNAGCEAARYDWLCKWDDDDWYPPRRLAETMRIADQHHAEIVGTGELLFHELAGARRTWIYEHDPVAFPAMPKRWLAINTALWQRQLWKRVPFPSRTTGDDDTVFIWNCLSPNKGNALATKFSDPGLCILMVHGQTTGRKVWEPEKSPLYSQWPGDVRDIMGSDLDAYLGGYGDTTL
jgi:glycosyltransferase involved in cell wall biosynthesis